MHWGFASGGIPKAEKAEEKVHGLKEVRMLMLEDISIGQDQGCHMAFV